VVSFAMLVINADDLGRSRAETKAALDCFLKGRITCATAMVFMEDSERAADLAKEHGLDVGLHLNLDQNYNGRAPAPAAGEAHRRVARFLASGKLARLIYHPLLGRQFRDVFQSQMDEFVRLYGAAPSHIDGHHHQHLCLNMVLGEVLPKGAKVRRNFSFEPGEKSFLNRAVRRFIDRRLARHHRLTDYFFTLEEALQRKHLDRIARLAKSAEVELETHPAKPAEYSWLLSEECGAMTRGLEMVPYASL
jgi:predicted glycoside hydrolase/deacetylase ChbG (UPF0249 family)